MCKVIMKVFPTTLQGVSPSSHFPRAIKFFRNSVYLVLAIISFQTVGAQTVTNTVKDYEVSVTKFKPESGLAATNTNDVRAFVYEWFTHFEHAATADYYLQHLDSTGLILSFPGQAPLTAHSDYVKWYNNLLAQTRWNFHDISNLQIKKTTSSEFLVSFVVNWYGEVKSTSDQLAGWQSRKDSYLYHYTLRQTWTVKDSNHGLIIQKLLVTAGNTASPIAE